MALTTQIKTALPWVCVLGLGAGMMILRARSRDTQTELAGLRQPSQELGRVRADNAGLEEVQAHADERAGPPALLAKERADHLPPRWCLYAQCRPNAAYLQYRRQRPSTIRIVARASRQASRRGLARVYQGANRQNQKLTGRTPVPLRP